MCPAHRKVSHSRVYKAGIRGLVQTTSSQTTSYLKVWPEVIDQDRANNGCTVTKLRHIAFLLCHMPGGGNRAPTWLYDLMTELTRLGSRRCCRRVRSCGRKDSTFRLSRLGDLRSTCASSPGCSSSNSTSAHSFSYSILASHTASNRRLMLCT